MFEVAEIHVSTFPPTLNFSILVEKNRHKAEANISARGIQIHAAAESDNMYSSIDSMTEKLDRQVIKHKEKQTNHHTQPIEPEVD